MRTTVSLDSDTSDIVRQRMARTGTSFERAANDAIRQSGTDGASGAEPFRTSTFCMGEPMVDLASAGALAADLEDGALIQSFSLGST